MSKKKEILNENDFRHVSGIVFFPFILGIGIPFVSDYMGVWLIIVGAVMLGLILNSILFNLHKKYVDIKKRREIIRLNLNIGSLFSFLLLSIFLFDAVISEIIFTLVFIIIFFITSKLSKKKFENKKFRNIFGNTGLILIAICVLTKFIPPLWWVSGLTSLCFFGMIFVLFMFYINIYLRENALMEEEDSFNE